MPINAMIAAIAIVSLWTPFINRVYFERWFGWPKAFFSALVPLAVIACACWLWIGLEREKHLQPFLAALGMFVLSYAGLGISFYPYMVPGALTIE
ncbi:cytochrome d ubiquinol oxidase subunit II [Martelella sp. FOR1707]